MMGMMKKHKKDMDVAEMEKMMKNMSAKKGM